ncbi:MAG: hypothetical protein AB8G14_15690 [Ilumatobacter sp.]
MTSVDMAPVEELDDPSSPDRPETSEPAKALRVLATAGVIVPFLTAALRALRNDWFPIGDNALLFIRTRDVLTEDHPYLGSWTSASLSVGENMNNPGAMYDWLMSPFAHALGPGPAAAIGVATINIAMICLISATAHRIGGWALQRWALLFSALLAWAMGSEMLIDIWQANALIFPFLALLVLSVGVAAGDDWLLPWAGAVTSLLLQTHISYAYVFVFIVIGVGAARVWQRREIDTVEWRRPVALSLGVVGVLWALSFWEQFFGPGKGNMSRLLGNASGGDFSLGLSNASKIVADLGVRPPFWGRSSYTTTVEITKITNGPNGATLDLPGLLPTGVAVLGILLLATSLAALTVAARRAGRHLEASAGVVATVVLLGSVLALSRLTIGAVGISPHHVRWAWPMMAFVHFTLFVLAVGAWRRSDRTDRHLTSTLIVVAVAAGAWNVQFLAQPSGPTADIATMPTMRRVEPQLEVLAAHQPVLYDVSTLLVFEPYSSTMMMWMQERGIEFRVDDEGMIRQLGEARRADGTEPTTVFQLQGSTARTYSGPGCVVAESSGLSSADAQDVSELFTAAADQLSIANATSPQEAFDALLRREFDVFEPEQQRRVDIWIDSAYILYGTGSVCNDV